MYDNWKKYNSNSDYQKLVNNMYEASKEDRLVFFIGAGVSINQGYPNWNGYVQKLLNYWKNEVNKFILESDEPNAIIKNSRKIGLIIRSNFGNKRKVDFLYQIIKEIKGLTWFNEHKLDFEEKFFINKSDEVDTSSLIYSLTKLNSFFITTNYDNEIETYLKFAHEVDNPYIDVEEIDYDNISTGTVMHIHGTPKGKSDHFINSTETYKNHYYLNNKFMDRIREFIDRKNCMLVFVGSSMEEDEVLSLISNKDNHFAIMKANDNLYKNGFFNTISSYNQDINNTKIFWYGNNFKDLPLFIEQLSNDVLDESDGYTGNDYYKFLNRYTPYREIIEIIDRITENQFINFIWNAYKIDKRLFLQRSKNILASEKFIEGTLYIPPLVWNSLLSINSRLNSVEINNIVTHIENSDSSYNQKECFDLFRKLQISKDRLQKFYDVLSEKKLIMWNPFSEDERIVGLTFLKSFKEENDSMFEDSTLENLKINLTNKMFNDFCNIMDEKCQNNFMDRGFDCDSLIKIPHWKFLYRLLNKNNLFIEGYPWYEMLNNKIFKNQIFIKLLMKLYKSDYMSPFLKLKIIKNVDLYNVHLGKVFNDFFNENSEEIKKQRKFDKNLTYVDDVYYSGTYVDLNKSYVNKDDLSSDVIIQKLLEISKGNIDFGMKDFASKDATIEYIIRIFSEENEDIENIIKDLLMNGFEKLFDSYKVLYVKILENKKVDSTYRINMNKMIIDYYKRYSEINYTYEDDILFNYLFGSKVREESLEIFFNLPVIGEESDIVSKENEYGFFEFMNSSVGRYLIKLNKYKVENNFQVNNLIKVIKLIKNNKFREIAEGMLFDVNAIHDFYITPYQLLGIFYGSVEVTKKDLKRLKNATYQILNIKDFDYNIKEFISFLSINLINPFEFGDNHINNVSYHMIFELIFHNKATYEFECKWLSYIINEYPEFLTTYIGRLLRNSISLDKWKKYKIIVEKRSIDAENMKFSYFNIDDFSASSSEVKEHISRIYFNLIMSERIKPTNLNALELILESLNDKEKKDAINKLKSLGMLSETHYHRLLVEFVKI